MILKINLFITIYTLIFNSCITFSYKFPENCGQSIVDSTESDWRIVRGTKTVSGEFPWQVVLVRQFFDEDKDEHVLGMCGGTIINENWILTAAHCVVGKDETEYEVYLGVHDFSTREGTEIKAQVEKVKNILNFLISFLLCQRIKII
jgi:secreted trypsin-like serine protease